MRKITLRDDSLPHQIRIMWWYGNIAVTCSCRDRYSPLEVRHQWEPEEPMQVWRAHMVDHRPQPC